jgi:hypothetical protein
MTDTDTQVISTIIWLYSASSLLFIILGKGVASGDGTKTIAKSKKKIR